MRLSSDHNNNFRCGVTIYFYFGRVKKEREKGLELCFIKIKINNRKSYYTLGRAACVDRSAFRCEIIVEAFDRVWWSGLDEELSLWWSTRCFISRCSGILVWAIRSPNHQPARASNCKANVKYYVFQFAFKKS